jgi:hypothetical protein
MYSSLLRNKGMCYNICFLLFFFHQIVSSSPNRHVYEMILKYVEHTFTFSYW